MMKRNVVLNIPHASINGVFDPKYGGWPCNQYFVNNCLNRWTDWYTDFLFLPLSRQKDVSLFLIQLLLKCLSLIHQ